MSMSVQGFQNPDNGPSYYKFSNSVLYRFNVNNSRGLDGNPDMQIDFVFVDTIAPNAPFLSYLGQITSIDDPGIYLKETYVVVTRDLATGKASFYFNDVNGHVLSVAPPNTGPNGTPNYEQNLGQPSIFTLSNGMRVFAGPRSGAGVVRCCRPRSGGCLSQRRGRLCRLQHQPDRGGSAHQHADREWLGSDGHQGHQRPHRRLGHDFAAAGNRTAKPQRSGAVRGLCAGRPRGQPADRRVADSAGHEGLLEPQPSFQ